MASPWVLQPETTKDFLGFLVPHVWSHESGEIWRMRRHNRARGHLISATLPWGMLDQRRSTKWGNWICGMMLLPFPSTSPLRKDGRRPQNAPGHMLDGWLAHSCLQSDLCAQEESNLHSHLPFELCYFALPMLFLPWDTIKITCSHQRKAGPLWGRHTWPHSEVGHLCSGTRMAFSGFGGTGCLLCDPGLVSQPLSASTL